MHLGLGDELSVQNELGETLKLRLVGFLQRSIFQSELLVSEANFKKHFPSQSGYAYFLIQAPSSLDATGTAETAERIGHTLESTLNDYGLDVRSTAEKLASYRAVENTYLSTFQILGGTWTASRHTRSGNRFAEERHRTKWRVSNPARLRFSQNDAIADASVGEWVSPIGWDSYWQPCRPYRSGAAPSDPRGSSALALTYHNTDFGISGRNGC